jgi:hypothetical protein
MTDWLREYPVPQTPPAWALNDVFLRIIDNAQKRWSDAGYDWKFGIEICFSLKTSKSLERNPDTLGLNWPKEEQLQGVTKDAWQQIEHYGRNTKRARKAVAQMRDEAAAIAVMHDMPVADVIAQLDEIDANLRSAKPDIKDDGMQNAYMAWIHSRTSDAGGVHDLIAPRFGDYLHGRGWWDDYQSAELRTQTLSSPHDVIINHHRLVDIVTRTAGEFGLVPLFLHGHTPHLHFSIWNRETGQNMMDYDDATLDFREGVASGILDLARQAPYLVTDIGLREAYMEDDFKISTWRVSTGVRQLDGHWELRRQTSLELGFMARDLAMLMAQSLPPILPPEQRTQPDFMRRQFLTEPSLHIKARHRFGNSQHMLAAVLSHSDVGEDNMLFCPYGCLEWGLETLQSLAGQHALNDFASRREEIEPMFNLSTQEGWEFLIKSLSYTDGKLQTGHLSPELQAMFDEIDIDGTFRVPSGYAVAMYQNAASFLHRATDKTETPFASELPDIISPEDWEAITAFYGDYMDHVLGSICSDDVIRLADVFRNAAADVEDPTPLIVKELSRIKRQSNEIGLAKTLMDIVTNTHGTEDIFDAGEVIAQPLEITRPYYMAALDAQIAKERAGDKPDNRQIAFLEATRSYANDHFFDFADILPHTVVPLVKGYTQSILDDQMSIVDIKSACLITHFKLNHLLWLRFREFDFDPEKLTARFTQDRAAWNVFWQDLRGQYTAQAEEKPLVGIFLKEMDDTIDDMFDYLMTVAQKATKEPPSHKLDAKCG